MSLENGIQPTMPIQPANNGSGNDGIFGGNGSWFIIILFLFVILGWGNGNFGNNGAGGAGAGGAFPGYVLTSDNANLERKLDGVNNGLCDGFYQQAQLINGVNLNMSNGFMTAELSRANQQAALMQQLFAMQMQAQNCCCETQQNIERNTNQGILNTNAIQQQISNCCCDIEKANMQSRFDAQAYNCNTLQAIDKLGDRIIDYISNDKLQTLRDENQALRLAASQTAQNDTLKAYVSGQFAYYNPRPVPSFPVPAPYQYGNCGGCCG